MENKQTKITICTKRSSHDDTYCGGLVDNGSNDVEISWGGGKKEGTVISLAYNERKYAYLFVNHLVTAASDSYDLTLNIDLETGNFAKKYHDQAELSIRLLPISKTNDILCQVAKDDSTLTFEGHLIGSY